MSTLDKKSNTVALQARNLNLAWDTSLIVKDLSLELFEGQIVSLVGRSGCGKTTLFHALSGLVTPLSGEVLLYGQDMTGHPGKVSYMLQKDLLLPQMTIMDNVCLPLVMAGRDKASARAQAQELLVRFGLQGTENLWPHQLSGGMRQRAALLRTYLMQNQVVLLDEPFSALDALTRNDMRSWFCSMVDELGLSCLVITHDVDEAVSISDRVYVLVGNPAMEKPSTTAGLVDINRSHAMREGFDLTQEFLDAKACVLDLLNQ